MGLITATISLIKECVWVAPQADRVRPARHDSVLLVSPPLLFVLLREYDPDVQIFLLGVGEVGVGAAGAFICSINIWQI